MARAKKPKTIKAITHGDSRKNIPTAEYQSVMKSEELHPVQVAYERRNRDLDPQLVWRGKDEQDAEPLVAQAPPLYIQEKVHPKVLIDSLKRYSREENPAEETIDLFADFNGLPEGDARTEFYQHEANWSNRMILRGQPACDGVAGGTGGAAGEGAVHLHGSAVWDQVQFEFPVVDDEQET